MNENILRVPEGTGSDVWKAFQVSEGVGQLINRKWEDGRGLRGPFVYADVGGGAGG